MVMEYLPWLEQLKMQGLDKWWYVIGVARVQVSLDLPKMVYFTHPAGEPYTVAVSEKGECKRFDFEGESGFTNLDWAGCQVGQNRLFRVSNPSVKYRFRILKMDPRQRCFSIEREEDLPKSATCCLANFKDEFVFSHQL